MREYRQEVIDTACFKPEGRELEHILNGYSKQGWRLCCLVPNYLNRAAYCMLLILEREVDSLL